MRISGIHIQCVRSRSLLRWVTALVKPVNPPTDPLHGAIPWQKQFTRGGALC